MMKHIEKIEQHFNDNGGGYDYNPQEAYEKINELVEAFNSLSPKEDECYYKCKIGECTNSTCAKNCPCKPSPTPDIDVESLLDDYVVARSFGQTKRMQEILSIITQAVKK